MLIGLYLLKYTVHLHRQHCSKLVALNEMFAYKQMMLVWAGKRLVVLVEMHGGLAMTLQIEMMGHQAEHDFL